MGADHRRSPDEHFEAFGMYTEGVLIASPPLRRAVRAGSILFSFNSNRDTSGWGAGGGFIIPVGLREAGRHSRAAGMGRRRVGRYGSSQFDPNDRQSERLARCASRRPCSPWRCGRSCDPGSSTFTLMAVARRILSQRRSFRRHYHLVTANPALANNSGCYSFEYGTCSGSTKDAWEITGGFWDKVYQGAFGSFRVGVQYEYIQRDLYPDSDGRSRGNLPVNLGASPKTNVNMVSASIRYYPFDAAPVAPPLVAKY